MKDFILNAILLIVGIIATAVFSYSITYIILSALVL